MSDALVSGSRDLGVVLPPTTGDWRRLSTRVWTNLVDSARRERTTNTSSGAINEPKARHHPDLSGGVSWPNFSPIPDLVKYLRTQSLVSVASLNVRRYKARWLERLRPLSPMKEVSALNGDGCIRLNPKYIAQGPGGNLLGTGLGKEAQGIREIPKYFQFSRCDTLIIRT